MGPTDYVVLELLNHLGGVQGRKRLQKLAYLAKLAGVPLEDEFFFHYYGPYSSGLASRVDQLVEGGLLVEATRDLAIAGAVEYTYDVSATAREFLNSVRPSVPAPFRDAMRLGIDRVGQLKDRDVFPLELAATLLYWLRKGHSWEEAEAITERRKKADRSSNAFREARQIAADVWKSRVQSGE